MRSSRRLRARVAACPLLLALLATPCCSTTLAAQALERPGVVGVGLLLRQMDGVKRVLMIGAHPDDEDTSFLTTLARGWGAETAYLSLTRGDGGQNVIGPELWEGLGVVRTGELDAARALDGGRQFFTRAFDYGFSKSADEALSIWPREELLGDIVWVIRLFRPQVIVSVWSGTPRDGHGQHQASGILAREAFDAAADPNRFPEQLARGVEAWSPSKYYVSDRFGGRGGGPSPGSLTIETGDLDPLLGRSAFQLSMESRSQHRSQEMGSPQPPGPRQTGVALVASRVQGGEGGFFAGVDTTLAGLTTRLPVSADGAGDYLQARRGLAELRRYREAVERARAGVGLDPSDISDELAEALRSLRGAMRDLDVAADGPTDPLRREIRRVLRQREDLVTRAFAAAAEIVLDVRAADDLLTPGQSVQVDVQLWNGGDLSLAQPNLQLGVPEGTTATLRSAEGVDAAGGVAPRTLATWTFDVAVPPEAGPSRLYYLREARQGAWYSWPDVPAVWGLSRDPAPVRASLSADAWLPGGVEPTHIRLSAPWRYVGVDPARGELSKRVLVVPAVSVQVSPSGLVWRSGSDEPRSITVVVRGEADGGSGGEVSVRAPQGWGVTPASQPFSLEAAGTERSLTFVLAPVGLPAPGEHVFEVVARTTDGREHREGYQLIDYDHIERATLYSDAEARVTVVPVAVAQGLRVGYVMGSGDDGPEAIRQLGVDVTLLDEARVRAGDFGAFDVLVLGVRAEETRPDLRAASGQLMDWVRGGGVVIAQYNRGPLGNLAPLRLEVDRGAPRVADETAPVRILEPGAPLFTAPNRIGPADFDEWVQERGLYFASEWDDGYVPLLELNDPGEPPARGSLLVAPAGEGVYVYTALSFFRQWTPAVPGAYRLFANLISLDPATWRAYVADH